MVIIRVRGHDLCARFWFPIFLFSVGMNCLIYNSQWNLLFRTPLFRFFVYSRMGVAPSCVLYVRPLTVDMSRHPVSPSGSAPRSGCVFAISRSWSLMFSTNGTETMWLSLLMVNVVAAGPLSTNSMVRVALQPLIREARGNPSAQIAVLIT
jgi:hypothetical protein